MLTDPSAHRPIGLELHQAVANALQEPEVGRLGPPGGGDAVTRPGAAGGSGSTAGERRVDTGHIGGQGARAGDAAKICCPAYRHIKLSDTRALFVTVLTKKIRRNGACGSTVPPDSGRPGQGPQAQRPGSRPSTEPDSPDRPESSELGSSVTSWDTAEV